MHWEMNRQSSKPRTANELLTLLRDGGSELGKGGRRLANFLVANPGDTALLTSAEVAQRCGVHASSVVRLAQGLGFSGYRELQSLLQKDLSASIAESKVSVDNISVPPRAQANLKLHLLGESGRSFNLAALAATERLCIQDNSIAITSEFHLPHEVDPQNFAQQMPVYWGDKPSTKTSRVRSHATRP